MDQIYQALGEMRAYERRIAQTLPPNFCSWDCPSKSSSTEEIELDQLPGDDSLQTKTINVCDTCGLVIEED